MYLDLKIPWAGTNQEPRLVLAVLCLSPLLAPAAVTAQPALQAAQGSERAAAAVQGWVQNFTLDPCTGHLALHWTGTKLTDGEGFLSN